MQDRQFTPRRGQPASRSASPAPKPPPKITIVRIDPLANAGNLKAKFDAKLGADFTLRELRLVHDAAHNVFWVSPPVREYVKDGQKKFWPLADWPRSWHDSIRDAAVAAYNSHPVPTATFAGEVRTKAGLNRSSSDDDPSSRFSDERARRKAWGFNHPGGAQ